MKIFYRRRRFPFVFCVSMRLLVIFLLLIFILNILLSEGFVTIPAWVAFGAITTAVKFKLILVKIMFALRTMGIGNIRIHKRSPHDTIQQQHQIFDAIELENAWKELEETAGRKIIFNLDVCIEGSLQEMKKLSTESRSLTTTTSAVIVDSYSKFVSRTIGSLTKSPQACEVLHESLNNQSQESS